MNYVKLEKEIYFPFRDNTVLLWWSFNLFPGDCYWAKVSKSWNIWWWSKELCSTYHAKIYSWAEQCLILGLLSRSVWILVNVFSWLKSLLLVLVKGQQLRHLVAHLFMNHSLGFIITKYTGISIVEIAATCKWVCWKFVAQILKYFVESCLIFLAGLNNFIFWKWLDLTLSTATIICRTCCHNSP